MFASVRLNVSLHLLLVLYWTRSSHQDELSFMQEHVDGPRCEPIDIPFCQNIEYNQTMMPNSLGHLNQNEVTLAVHQYFPALKVKCNPDIQFFVCSNYAPICTDPGPLLPCRSLCLSVKNDCDKVLSKFGIKWPPDVDCNRFPDDSNDIDNKVLCVSKNQTSLRSLPASTNEDTHEGNPFPKMGATDFYPSGGSKEFAFTCPDTLRLGRGYDDAFKVGNAVAKNCGLPCDGMFFTPQERQFSRMWIGTWSIVCAISCLFTVLTFSLNTSRFRYPERPIIFLAVCYLIISLIYVAGFLSADKLACRRPLPYTSEKLRQAVKSPVSTIVQGTKNEFCTIMFIGLYFFSMASSLWWVILALTWFLAAGLKWGHEAIEANSQYFHLAAWAIPTIKTITILAMGKVEGDVLTGVCYVGLWNLDTMRGFILIPLSVYLVIGIIFLLLGFISLFRIRTAMKHDGTKTDKLEKLMLRIGIFSVLYTVPAVTVIVCLFYEQLNFDQWMVTWHRQICQSPNTLIRCPPDGPTSKPNFLIFMLKYLSSLIVGITSSVWVWSSKTMASWRQLFNRLRGKQGQTYV